LAGCLLFFKSRAKFEKWRKSAKNHQNLSVWQNDGRQELVKIPDD
jgi:hypothetical protein